MIYSNGILKMNAGATITGNGFVGVSVCTFEMTGGTISGNTESGVSVSACGGGFIMSGGTISGNTSSHGGGGVYSLGSFTMTGGTISNNTSINGGGVYVFGGIFEMTGGTISNNTATSYYGGGVDVYATFIMRGGTITGNTAATYGGGVYAGHTYRSSFTKTGGTITGYSTGNNNNNNRVNDGSGILARRGHAVYVHADMRKETTAGTGVSLSSSSLDNWDE